MMVDWDKMIDFPEYKAPELRELIARKRAELKDRGLFVNTIVREDIFDILGAFCTVVYYPLEDEQNDETDEKGNDGFHISLPVSYRQEGREHFVFLNTAKPIEKQVFAAAHELGHIWTPEDAIWDEELEAVFPKNHDNIETAMNRFAAELLMPYDEFRQSAAKLVKKHRGPGKGLSYVNALRVVAGLMDEFCVPDQAVIRRFYETRLFPKDVCKRLTHGPKGMTLEDYRAYYKKTLADCITEGDYIRLGDRTEKRGIQDFPRLLREAEERGVWPEEKIARLRAFLGIPEIEAEEPTPMKAKEIETE